MNPRKMRGTELSYPERQFLELRLMGKWSLRRIAGGMGRDHSVLSREVRRNRGRDGRYRAAEAQRKAGARRPCPPKGSKIDRLPGMAEWCAAAMREYRSPERVAGRSRLGLAPGGAAVCHETVYQWLYRHGGRYGGLADCLWTRRRRRYARKGRKPRHARIEGKMPLSERVEDGRPGHLESDSMVWRSSRGLLSVQVDRAIKICRLRWCGDRTAEETSHALRRAVETLPHRYVRSMAFDNGSEGARHGILKEEYGVDTFFCEPYSPWQKPQVENLNRTIRHWLPRKTKAQDLAALDWHEIEERLNDLPRESLGYLTPNEALNQYLASGGALVA